MDVEFDPIRCAELHNRLVAKAIQNIPGASAETTQDILQTWALVPLDQRRAEIPADTPLNQFLSRINTYRPGEIPLTPEFHQPCVYWFDNPMLLGDGNSEGRDFVLLYGDSRDFDSGDKGGLYFDLDTCLVVWGHLMDNLGLPAEEEWVPLELALKKALEMWDIGKFQQQSIPMEPEIPISLRNWIPSDLDDAIVQWERLLNAIRDRIPVPEGTPVPSLQDPLSSDLVGQLQINSYSKAFLTKAKRPTFTFVAPGITTFSPASIVDLYGSESVQSLQRQKSKHRREPFALILPAIPGTIADGPRCISRGHESNSRPNFTISNRSGVYIMSSYPNTNGDCADLVTAEGLFETIRWEIPRPWGPSYGLRLVDLLWVWASAVEEGEWEINTDGVSTTNDWYSNPSTENARRLVWSEDNR